MSKKPKKFIYVMIGEKRIGQSYSINYHRYKADFYSAYNANGKNIELALSQVAMLRQLEVERLKTILQPLIEKLTIK